jgi:hypothetical protein
MRRRAVGVALAVVVIAVVAVTQLRRTASDPPADAAAAPGMFHVAPFHTRLSGPLWGSRLLRDRDGADDFALVAGDLPLDVQVRASGRTRIAAVELRIDGRLQPGGPPACGQADCAAEVTVTLVPRLRGVAAGAHRVELYARAAGARAPKRAARFDVRTAAGTPTVVEGETATNDPAPAAHDGDAELASSALAVLAAERNRPGLAQALSGARVNLLQSGPLNARGRRLGATIWIAVEAPLRDVRATVPGYAPSAAATGAPYTLQRVRMHVAVLRDALIDVDLTTRRVIAFEPGPRSRTISWAPSRTPAPAGAQDED